MLRQEVLDCLASHKQHLVDFDIKSLALFGSVARNESTTNSDVDFLVEFHQPVGLFYFLQVRQYLSSILNSPVDLVTLDALKPKMRERILKELVHVS